MGTLKTLTQAEKELGITRPTLLKHIRRAGIQVQFNKHDQRVKLLNEGQIAQLREIITINKKEDRNDE